MTTYVLVGGAWQRVARRLRDNGHDVYPVTLTGLGERVHLASPEVDLETHITDVVNLIEFEDLHDVVLLGHSYGGLVVTGAADRIPERISQLVYLDTAPLPDGAILLEKFPLEARERTEDQVQEMIASGHLLFSELSGPKWRFVELPTGHWPMFSRPEDLAGLLLDIPSDASTPPMASG